MFCKRFTLQRLFSNVGERTLDREKILCMLKHFSSLERSDTFANDRVTRPTHAQRWIKTTMDVYQRFRRNRKTLGLRWQKRNGVTAPLVEILRWTSVSIGEHIRVNVKDQGLWERKCNKKPSCRLDSRPYCLTVPLGSRDVIGHVTIGYPICHFLLVVLWNQASLTVSEIFNVECSAMVDMTLIRPLKNLSISYIRLPIGWQ